MSETNEQGQTIEVQPPEVEPRTEPETPTAAVSAPAPISEPAPVQPVQPQPVAQPQANIVLPASIWKRLLNHILDGIFQVIIITALLAVSSSMPDQTAFLPALLILVVALGYHLIMESIWQRTIAKFITGTKVVDNHGDKPSFLKILGRSVARWIPFEPFSLLVSEHPRGWHDMLSRTLVVDSSLTDAQLKSIDIEAMKAKQHTSVAIVIVVIIIVVFVTIAIIGILSSIILASLSTARAKGVEAKVQSNMVLFKTHSIVYEGQERTFKGFCTSPKAKEIMDAIESSSPQFTSSDIKCNDNDKEWALSVSQLASSYPGYFCIDDQSRQIAKTKFNIGDDTSCPTEAPESMETIDIDGMDSVRN